MPLTSASDVNPWLTGQSEGSGLKRVILVGLALLFAGAASAQELKSPRISVAKVDWDAAAASIVDRPAGTPAEAFAKLNAATGISFPKIADSSVPVLLPYDVDAFIKDRAANPEPPPEKAVENADRFMRSGFRPTRFFVTGPAGYDSAFALTLADVRELSDIRYAEPVYVLFSGLAMTYELDGPAMPDGELVKSLQDEYPGIRRYLHEFIYPLQLRALRRRHMSLRSTVWTRGHARKFSPASRPIASWIASCARSSLPADCRRRHWKNPRRLRWTVPPKPRRTSPISAPVSSFPTPD